MIEIAEIADAHEAEEECILYVAMSRARTHLMLYRPRRRSGRNASPSRFLASEPIGRASHSSTLPRSRPLQILSPTFDPPATEAHAPLPIQPSETGNARCSVKYCQSLVN